MQRDYESDLFSETIDFSELFVYPKGFRDHMLFGIQRNQQISSNLMIYIFQKITRYIYDIEFFVFIKYLEFICRNLGKNKTIFYIYRDYWEKRTIQFFFPGFIFLKKIF
jgi:hypothetical protein